jgi:hypothetical protein
MKSIHLRIDRIVVEGLPASGQQQLAGALAESLRELAASGIADQFAGNTRKRVQSLNAGQLRPGATPAQAATQIVHSIRQNITGRGSTPKHV